MLALSTLLLLATQPGPSTSTTEAPAAAPERPTPPLSRPAAQSEDERMLCAVTPELRVAVLHGTDADTPAAALLSDLQRFGCLRLFALPVSIPMGGDAIAGLPEGAARIADRIGVDWIIAVSPQTAPDSVTARLVEVSNLGVIAAKTGSPADVAKSLLTPVRDEIRRSMDEGVRVTVTLEPATYKSTKALQAAMFGQPRFVEVGNVRLVDGKGLVVVKYKGSVDALAALLDGKDLKGTAVQVSAVKLRRIELAPATPTPP